MYRNIQFQSADVKHYQSLLSHKANVVLRNYNYVMKFIFWNTEVLIKIEQMWCSKWDVYWISFDKCVSYTLSLLKILDTFEIWTAPSRADSRLVTCGITRNNDDCDYTASREWLIWRYCQFDKSSKQTWKQQKQANIWTLTITKFEFKDYFWISPKIIIFGHRWRSGVGPVYKIDKI